MRTATIILAVAALAALAVVAGGCQAPTVAGGAVKLAETDSAAYLDQLSAKPAVTEAEAVNGILLVLGEKKEQTFDQAVAALRQRKIADATWDFKADRPVTRGRVAYMVFQALKLRGGVVLMATGPSQRYCLRELQYLGFMAQGLPYNPVTGMEYVSILARADQYRQTGKVSPVLAPEIGEEQ